MGLEIKKLTNLPIGVDLGSSSLKMAQLRLAKAGTELLFAASADMPLADRGDSARQMEFESDTIRSFLKSGAFKGRKAMLSVPSAEVLIEPVRIPMDNLPEADTFVEQELSARLPYAVDEAVVRHIVVGSVYSGKQEMQERIVVAARRADMDRYVAMADRAGLDVVGVNVEACAVLQCFARLFRRAGEQSRVTLFIDIGSSSTQVVLSHGSKMVFARNLKIGGQTFDQAVAETLQIPVDQAHHVQRQLLGKTGDPAAQDDLFRLLDKPISELARQLDQCLRYHESLFNNRYIDRVVFIGGQAHNSRLCRSLAERLNVPAQVGNPLVGIRRAARGDWVGAPDAREPQPAWAVAVGLSLGAVA